MQVSFTISHKDIKDPNKWVITDQTNEERVVYHESLPFPLFTIKQTPWLPDGNVGLHTNVPFGSGDIIGFYHGEQVNPKEYTDGTYVFVCERPRVQYLDARPILDKAPFALINSPHGHPENKRANTEFTSYGYIRTTRRLVPGEELLIDYGDDYDL